MALHRLVRFGALARARSLASLAIVLALLMASVVPAFAAGGQQGNINGTVVDASTRAAIPGAVINAVSPSGSYHTTTDSHGNFVFLGVAVDTYTISVSARGFEDQVERGVTVIGDQNINVGQITLSKQLRTIGRVTSRSLASAYQPSQTVDSVTISGARMAQTTGKAETTNLQSLVLAAPGVSISNGNNISIRGGLATEVGYQYDGIPFAEPFLSAAGSQGVTGNPAFFSGLGSVQIVEGAGDATQGNIGGGVVNLIPKRGSYPGFGLVDAEAGSPNFSHQLGFEYGIATRNGRISDYISYVGQRYVPYEAGLTTTDVSSVGQFYGPSYETNDEIVNNFVYKFGKDNNQSFQVLYQNRLFQEYGFAGGFKGQQIWRNDQPSLLTGIGVPSLGFLANVYGSLAAAIPVYQNMVSPAPNDPKTGFALTQSPLLQSVPERFLKFEYDNNLNPTTFLNVKYYNWASYDAAGTNLPTSYGNFDPQYGTTGGQRSGVVADIIKQFSSKHTVTLSGNYELQRPVWDGYFTEDLFNQLGVPPGVGQPSIADFLQPVGGVCPYQPTSSNPAPGCYLAKYFPNGIPKVPAGGINYHGSIFNFWSGAIREQWAPNSRLHADLGFRLDGADYRIAPNPANVGAPNNNSNTGDVNPASLTSTFFKPTTTEPRAAITYAMGANDSLRAGYGRSIIWLNAQTFGTPGALYNYQPFLNVPPIPGPNGAQAMCGSPGTPPTVISGGLFPCKNYAQQLFWLWDNNHDFPDYGNFARFSSYQNYDLTYQHQFPSGWGMRLTPFYKYGSNLPGISILKTFTDAAGAVVGFVFSINNVNVNKTSGLEFNLTTPDRPYGLSGFLSMTYQNVIDRVSPLSTGEDAVPTDLSNALKTNATFRAGYVSPFVARLGVEWKSRSGLRVNPIVNYIRGYPFSVGTTTPSSLFCPKFIIVPQVNFGCGLTAVASGLIGSSLGGANATQYIDPALPGNTYNPNIAATRGSPATSSAGGVLSKPTVTADLDIEFKTLKRNTFGVFIQNLFGNPYTGVGAIPSLNPFWQPVSTGTYGPQTGLNGYAYPGYAGGIFQNHGNANLTGTSYDKSPYTIFPQRPTSFNFYYQLSL